MDDLAICSSSADPLIAANLPRQPLTILKNGHLYGTSQSVQQNVNPPLAPSHHQVSHITFSSPFLPH